MKKGALASIFALLALVSCATNKTPLDGERTSIFTSTMQDNSSDERIVLSRPDINKSWTSVSGNSENNKGHMAGRRNFSERIRSDIGVNYPRRIILYPPVADETTVFTIDGNLHVSAIDIETGMRIWHNTHLSNRESLRFGALALGDEALFVLANDSRLIKLDPKSGKVIYDKSFGTTVKSGLQICGTRLYFISDESELISIDTASGEKVFGHRTLVEPFGFIRGSTPACEGSRVVAAFPNGEAHMLMDGTPIWFASLLRSDIRSVNTMSDIVANPVIGNGIAIVKSYAGSKAAFELREGRELWSRTNTGTATPVLSNGIVFDIDSNSVAYALDARTGNLFWSTRIESARRARPLAPILVNNQLLIAFTSGELAKLDPYTGKLISIKRIAFSIDTAPIIIGDRLIIISNGNLRIYR